MYTVSITSQGQISIPAPIRRKLGLDKKRKVSVSLQDGKIVLEPSKDLLDFAGTFKTKKKGTPSQIRKAFGEYLAKQAVSYDK
ncbi:AbrB/MazE/SpoVT family DNA-binding domain-containing protein [Patescibacteria group bacterium]|nr:AbrB/MazE/SpoVT family DNA-binding domain-containing protein [Patescibacteria group bacterium]